MGEGEAVQENEMAAVAPITPKNPEYVGHMEPST